MKRIKIILSAVSIICATQVFAQQSSDLTAYWTKYSHSNEVKPNYSKLFPSNKIQRIDIKIESSDWATICDELEETFGAPEGMGMGGGMQHGGPGMEGGMEGGRGMMGNMGDSLGMMQRGAGMQGMEGMQDMERGRGMMGNMGDSLGMMQRGAGMEGMEMGMQRGRGMMGNMGDSLGMMQRGAGMEGMEGGMPPMGMQEGRGMEGGMQHGQEMGQAPGGMGGGGGIGRGSSAGSSLQWVPCTITYDGRDWYKVGMRFKGNSSLMKTAREGSKKLSIKLDFDQYENEYPELKNQRFYGFKQLNLSNNCNDASLLREKITTDLYREFGIVAAHTSHYELYVDYGEGAQLFGVYTLVEEVDDSVIGNAFSDDSGNLYKPEERAGSFAEGTFNEEQFYLKTNKKKADYSDVRALYDIINSEERTTNQKAWKKKLEKVFDVDVFLKWLAANTAVQNWDTYGHMAHNYFLYTNPKTGKITWISWDHNEALQGGMRAYEAGQLSSVAATWPLISYIITVDEYKAKFDKYLKEFTENIFYPSKMIATYEDYYNLLKDYADKSDIGTSFSRNGLQFDQAIEQLKLHVVSRRTAITDYLESK